MICSPFAPELLHASTMYGHASGWIRHASKAVPRLLMCMQQGFVEELKRAPAAARPALEALARLYGLTRVERHMAVYLATGALKAKLAPAVRLAVNGTCAALSAQGGKPALLLCDGFGVPDHLLAAPIAFDWKAIGTVGEMRT